MEVCNHNLPRLCVDEHFLSKLFAYSDRKLIFTKLGDIHRSSEKFSIQHNFMTDASFKVSIDVAQPQRKERVNAILGSIHPIQHWVNDSHTSVIKMCIGIADNRPYKVYILTDSDNKQVYLENEHYKPYENLKKAIEILNFEESLVLINEFHSKILKE